MSPTETAPAPPSPPQAWRSRATRLARNWPLRIVLALYLLYLLAGFFLMDPLARRLLPWAGERMLASRLAVQRVDFNPFTLELRAQGLALTEPQGGLLAGCERLYVNLGLGGLLRGAWQLQSVELERPHTRLELRPGGASNWSTLAARLREDAKPSDGGMPRVLIDHIRIVDGDLGYTDTDRAGSPYQTALRPLNLELEAISTLPEDSGDYLLTARMPDQGATLRWKGAVGVNPLVSEGEVSIVGGRIGRLAQALQGAQLQGELAGTLSAQLHYRFAMPKEGEAQQAPAFTITRGQVKLQDVALTATGATAPLLRLPLLQADGIAFDLRQRTLDVGRIHLEGGDLAATRDAAGALDWQSVWMSPPTANSAPAAPAAATAPWRVQLRSIQLADWALHFTDASYARPLRASAQGLELSTTLEAEFGAQARVQLGALQAALGPLRLDSGEENVAELQHATLTGGSVQLPGPLVRLEAVQLRAPRTTVRLDKQQQVNWAEILRRPPGAPAAAASAPAKAASAPASTASAPAVHIAQLAVQDVALKLEDASPASPVALDVAGGSLTFTNLSLDLAKPVPVQAVLPFTQGGRLEARGQFVPGQPAGQIDVRLAGLPLKPFAPYVNRYAQLVLQSGSVATQGKLTIASAAAGPTIGYTGGAAVDDLAITEEATGDPFLGWKKLATDSLRVALAAQRQVNIGELTAQAPFGKLIIFEDRTLNLQRMRRAPAAAPVPALATTRQATASNDDIALSVERLRVADARMEFADLSLRPQFGTRIHALEGVVTGLSTATGGSAQVELDGKVDDHGSARLRGSLQPFRASEATDLRLAFRNLEMNRLTPYSGKFAGRRIDAGRLSVDLEYKVRERQLAGNNKFVIEKLKLGEAVDSPDAMKLPLDLAIALLEDSNGVIDLDLPVSGNLDDPQFSYGALIGKAIVNVLAKLVTAPFRALGSLLGVQGEAMEAIAFEPGASVLPPPEQEKTKLLAQSLAKRPALTLTITPGYDPEADRRALQEAEMRRLAAAAAGRRLAAGENPGPVDVNDYKVQGWLEDRYEAQLGKEAHQKIRERHAGQAGGTGARVMQRLERTFGSRDNGPPSKLHAEMVKDLTGKVAIEDTALVALAQARAAALREALLKQGLEPAKLSVGAPAARAAKEGLVACGLGLGVAKAGS